MSARLTAEELVEIQERDDDWTGSGMTEAQRSAKTLETVDVSESSRNDEPDGGPTRRDVVPAHIRELLRPDEVPYLDTICGKWFGVRDGDVEYRGGTRELCEDGRPCVTCGRRASEHEWDPADHGCASWWPELAEVTRERDVIRQLKPAGGEPKL